MLLQAPTPFLMGLHSSEPVDQRTLDMLVVADLDRGTLQLSKDDSLLQRCLSHPYMQRLERRVRCVGLGVHGSHGVLIHCTRQRAAPTSRQHARLLLPHHTHQISDHAVPCMTAGC